MRTVDLAHPLIVGRVLQGAALPVMSISLSLMREQLSRSMLPVATGAAAAALGLGNGLGLAGGGFLLDRLPWGSVFSATVVMTVPLAVAVVLVVPRDRPRSRQSLDLIGTGGLVAILLCLLLTLSKVFDWGISVPVFTLPLASLVLLPWWARGRLRHPHPVIDLRALRSRPLLSTHLGAAAAGYSGFKAFIVTTHALQNDGPEGFGLTLTEAGLWMVPASVSFLLTGPLTAVLIRRVGLRATYATAGLVTAVGAAGMAALGLSFEALLVLALVVFVGNGLFLAALPVGTAAFTEVDAIASTNGVNALARTGGIAFASGVFALVSGAVPADDVRDVLLWGQVSAVAVTLAVTAVCWWCIPHRRAPVKPPGIRGRIRRPSSRRR